MCQLNSPKASYRVDTNKKKEAIIIIIILLELAVLLRVKKCKVGVYDLQWLDSYAAKEICIYTLC
jgi:hypothetical protein